MKTIFAFALLLLFFIGASSQPLSKKWDYRYGGNATDALTCFRQTTDGGYILGGFSASGISGDKTQGIGASQDYWIVKLDSSGLKQWDKNFGGPDYDNLMALQQTKDGGYILGGYSFSGAGGDKTQGNWGANDYWVVKTDSLGNKEWDKDFGGDNFDVLYDICQTADGSYLLGGESYSGIGGDKTQFTYGSTDFWILKIDSLGNKIWDKDYGSTGSDDLYALQQTSDGGFMLAGWSASPTGADKSQPSWGDWDYWMIKIDSAGVKQWDKDFGGTAADVLYCMHQTSDHGYILGGFSLSGMNGDKSQPLLDTNAIGGASDFWILKTDSTGAKMWDKKFGGLNTEDEFGNVVQTADGGYLVTGTSYSDISGDKTENNLGREQTWIIKTDAAGNRQWDKTLHTTCSPDDESGFGIQTKDGCFAFANYTNGGIAGDKTQPQWNNSYDYWIIKFCDTLQALLPVAGTSASGNICPGTCTDFINSSTNATSFQWTFNGASPGTSTAVDPTGICYNTPGSYDVQLIATNANGSDTLTLSNFITVYPYPAAQGISQNGDTLFANPGATTYRWYLNGNILSGSTDYFYIAQVSGNYNVVCTDSNGCEAEAAIFDVIASIQGIMAEKTGSIEISPNPVTENLVLKFNAQIEPGSLLIIRNTIGEAVQTYTYSESSMVISVAALNSGMYWVEIHTCEKIYRTGFVKL